MTDLDSRALSFGAVADDYDRLRPSAPDEAVAWLLPERCDVAVDLGAGTGIFTRALARRVPDVIAVEPDERMRAVLAARTPTARVLDGRGEAIPLPEAGVDAVLVSSAWHWMDASRAIPEIARVLRDGGRFGVVWTSRDRDAGWVHHLDRLGLASSATAGRADDGRRERRPHEETSLPDSELFADPAGGSRAEFPFTRRMTIDDLVDLQTTYSRFISLSGEDRAATLARARELLAEQFPGATEIDVPMRAWCWRADRLPRPATG